MPSEARRTRPAADARPPATFCEHKVLAFQLERLRGRFQTGLQVLTLQIRELGQHIFKRVACRGYSSMDSTGYGKWRMAGLPWHTYDQS